MATTRYMFLPWMRQGLVRNITEADALVKSNLDPSDVSGWSFSTERAELNVNLNWNGDQTTSKTVKIFGPGDITSINKAAILDYEPQPKTIDNESNYLPYITFYEEDFPWRYSPVRNVQAGELTGEENFHYRIRPWLALIAVKEGEYTIEGGMLVVLDNNIFHNNDEHWAWAHVHYNPDGTEVENYPTLSDFPQGGGMLAQVINDSLNSIKQNPDKAFSRLVCPRRLEKDTRYHMFLIPAFETGRLAGIGEPTANVPAQYPSWGDVATNGIGGIMDSYVRPAEKANYFPIYAKWDFKTGTQGDFETLALQLKPTVASPESGTRLMSLEDSGYGLFPSYSYNAKIEGALKPPIPEDLTPYPDYEPTAWPAQSADGSASDVDYINDLVEILNLQTNIRDETFNEEFPSHPFYAGGTIGVQDDPIVLPPMYGQWHGKRDKVVFDPAENEEDVNWFDRLNYNPAYRAVAGLGAKVVRNNQEEFISRAWEQIGDILDINQKLKQAELAGLVSQRLYVRYIKPSIEGKTQEMTSPMYNKVRFDETKTVGKEIRNSNLPEAVFDRAFRKIVKSNRKMVQRTNATTTVNVVKKLVQNFNESVTKAAPPLAVPSNIGMPLGTSFIPGFASEVSAAVSAAEAYNIANEAPEAMLGEVENRLRTELEPIHSIPKKMKRKLLKNGPDGYVSVQDLDRIAAHPKIGDPMFEQLKEISNDYIVPNLSEFDNNAVTLMETNKAFIESYMLGLNHEMSRELLWREYPTDLRGTYFRQFWNVMDTVADEEADEDSLLDIERIHDWDNNNLSVTSGKLGGNHTARFSGAEKMVLLIRGDLMRKFPDALVYAQKAVKEVENGQMITEGRVLDDSVDSIQFPIFRADLGDGIVALGFDLTKEDVMTHIDTTVLENNNPGYFFVFRERPGKVRFGLDEGTTGDMTLGWNGMSWGHLDDPSHVSTNSNANGLSDLVTFLNGEDPNLSLDDLEGPLLDTQVKWGDNAADMAYILYQKPSIVAIHADEMLGVRNDNQDPSSESSTDSGSSAG